MTDEVDELLHEDELDIPLPDDLEAEAEGLRVEELGAGDTEADLEGGTEGEADGALDEEELDTSTVARETSEESDDEDDDLEGLPEDVEASLDEILRAQLTAADEEGFVERRRADAEEDRAVREFAHEDGGAEPRHPDEFMCRSCFLVKHRRLMVDADRGYCCDCA